MVKKHYLPRALEKRVSWLNNFAERFEEHGSALGFSPEQIEHVKNDAAMLSYAAKVHRMMKGTYKSFTAFKDMLNEGAASKEQLLAPILPELPAAPVLVAPGIFRRIGKLVQLIKVKASYTDVIGVGMGIIGPEQKINFSQIKPQLKTKLSGGYLIVYWNKSVFTGINLSINRDDGKGFIKGNYFSRNPAKLKIDLPVGQRSALWQIVGNYRIKDDLVGQPSPTVEVAVRN